MTEHIAFLGTGSMNGSIAAGLIAGGYPAEAIRATVRSKNSCAISWGLTGETPS